MSFVQEIIDMIDESLGLVVGAWVRSRPVILPRFENHGFVAVGQITRIERRNGQAFFTVRADNDNGHELSFETWELTAISLLDAIALADLDPGHELLRRDR